MDSRIAKCIEWRRRTKCRASSLTAGSAPLGQCRRATLIVRCTVPILLLSFWNRSNLREDPKPIIFMLSSVSLSSINKIFSGSGRDVLSDYNGSNGCMTLAASRSLNLNCLRIASKPCSIIHEGRVTILGALSQRPRRNLNTCPIPVPWVWVLSLHWLVGQGIVLSASERRTPL